MNNKENNWITRTIPCAVCEKGVVPVMITPERGKPFRARIPCERCSGLGTIEKMAMQYCEMPDCENESLHECQGAFCWGNGWVCDEHWTEESIGFSEKGFACSACCDEVGAGGH